MAGVSHGIRAVVGRACSGAKNWSGLPRGEERELILDGTSSSESVMGVFSVDGPGIFAKSSCISATVRDVTCKKHWQRDDCCADEYAPTLSRFGDITQRMFPDRGPPRDE